MKPTEPFISGLEHQSGEHGADATPTSAKCPNCGLRWRNEPDNGYCHTPGCGHYFGPPTSAVHADLEAEVREAAERALSRFFAGTTLKAYSAGMVSDLVILVRRREAQARVEEAKWWSGANGVQAKSMKQINEHWRLLREYS